MFCQTLTTIILLNICQSRAENSATEAVVIPCNVSQSDGLTTFTIQYEPDFTVEDCIYSWSKNGTVFANQEQSSPGLVANRTARDVTTSQCSDEVQYLGRCAPMWVKHISQCTANCTKTGVENGDQSGENKTAIIADVPVAATLVGVGVGVGVVVMVLVICCIYKSRIIERCQMWLKRVLRHKTAKGTETNQDVDVALTSLDPVKEDHPEDEGSV